MPDFSTLQQIDQQVNPPPPPAPTQQNMTPVIDVGGSSDATPGQPGSQYAPAGDVRQSGDPTKAAPPPVAAAPPQPAGPGPSAPPVDNSFAASPMGQKLAAATAAMDTPEPSKVPAGKKTGLVANMGAGTSESVAGMLGMPVDLATGAINLVPRAVNAVAGTNIPTIQNPVGGSEWWKGAEGLVGADPRNVVPDGSGQMLARVAARGATDMALPGGIAKALPAAAGAAGAVQSALAGGAGVSGATMGSMSAMGGQLAANAVPDQYKPLADFLGQLGAGGATGITEAALRGGMRTAGAAYSALRDPLSVGRRETIIEPTTGASVTATPGQLQIAGRQIAKSMGMTPEQAAASIPPSRPLVDGSIPTMGQATGNVGLLNEENKLRGSSAENRAAFTNAEARNNNARATALQGVAPKDAANAAVRMFRDARARFEARGEADIGAAKARADTKLSGMGGDLRGNSAEDMGAEQRAALEAHRQPVKSAASRLYDKIDPDGRLALDVDDVGKAAREIMAEVDPTAGDELSAAESAPLEAATSFRGVETFAKLRKLDKNVAAAMRKIKSDPALGAESEPFRRMAMLRGAIDAAMEKAVEERAMADQTAVNAGVMAPEKSIVNALDEGEHDAGTEAVGTPAHGASGVVAKPKAGSGQNSNSSQGGVSPEGQGAQAGRAGGNSGLASSAANEVKPLRIAGANRKPESIVDAIIARGGVQDPTGDLTAMGLDTVHHRTGGRLINPNGMSPDYMRESLAGDGFLRPNSDINDFYDAMAEHASGNHRFRIHEQHEGEAWGREAAQRQSEADARYDATDRINVASEEAGVRLSPAERAHATELHMQGMEPHQAIEEAVRAGDDEVLQRNAEHSAVGSPGVPIAAQQAEMPVSGGKRLEPNFTERDKDAIRAANAAYRDYKNVYHSGAVGDVLASGKNANGYRLTDAQVPAKIFRGGVAGGDAADSLIKAAGSREAALGVLGDYPAFALRQKAEVNGALDLKKYDRFMADHKAVFDKFPELRSRFENVAQAQREVDAAAARHVQRMNNLQDSAARFYLGKGDETVDPQVAIGKLLSSDNPAAEATQLMQLAKGDLAATDGIRRNLIDWIWAKSGGATEAGTTGEKAFKGAVYQNIINDPKISRALDAILTPDQAEMLRRIAKDIEVGARSVGAVKIPGSPGTAADLHALGGDHGVSTIVQMEVAERSMEIVGNLVHKGGLIGSVASGVAAIGGAVHAVMRQAGLGRVAEVKTAAVLNPELGRLLLQRSAVTPKAPIWKAIGKRLAAVTLGTTHEDDH